MAYQNFTLILGLVCTGAVASFSLAEAQTQPVDTKSLDAKGQNPAFIDRTPVQQAEPFDLADVRLLDGVFKANELLDQKFLLSLDVDRLLYSFRVTAHLPTNNAKPFGGWERPGDGLRGHFVGHYLSACAEMYAATGDPVFKERGTQVVTELGKCQDAIGTGYLSAFPTTSFDEIEMAPAKTSSAPYYTIHKIMAGLLDQYHYCGNEQALTILCKMADYFQDRLSKLPQEKLDAALFTDNRGGAKHHEFGGMSEVLHNLYCITGKPQYLTCAHTFDRALFFTPLSLSQDQLAGLHANTHIPQAIGFARHYEITGDETYRHAADFFWSQVTDHHSYVTGSDSRGEAFLAPDAEGNALSDDTAETCNVYNMLKLTEHEFTWKAEAPTADYYERALYNHILSSIEPVNGAMTYYLSLKPGHYKLYGAPEAFWCCTGTGVENHAKYGSAIYYHHGDTLWVNLFMASQLTWKEKGVTLIQNTSYPESDTTTLSLAMAQPTKLKILLRDPGWETQAATVTVNGQPQSVTAQPGTYIALEGTWMPGDKITLRLPMNLYLHRPVDNPKMIAIMYGPVVLAGELGSEGMPPDQSIDWRAFFKLPDPSVPSLKGDPANLSSWVKAEPGQALHFTVAASGTPSTISFKPLYQINHERYSVYWKFDPAAAQ